MVATGIGALLGTGGGISGSGGAAGPSAATSRNDYAGSSIINIAPVGVNLGAFLQESKEPTSNGGMGLSTPSRMFPATGFTDAFYSPGSATASPIVGIAMIAGVGLLLFFAAKKWG